MNLLNSLIGLVILILDIVTIVNIVKSSMSTALKVVWTIVILIFPLLGLILYYLIAKK